MDGRRRHELIASSMAEESARRNGERRCGRKLGMGRKLRVGKLRCGEDSLWHGKGELGRGPGVGNGSGMGNEHVWRVLGSVEED